MIWKNAELQRSMEQHPMHQHLCDRSLRGRRKGEKNIWRKNNPFTKSKNLILLCCAIHSVMSNSLWPHGLYHSRLLCLWGFSRQEYWSGLPGPPPGDLPNTEIEPSSSALAGKFFTICATRETYLILKGINL